VRDVDDGLAERGPDAEELFLHDRPGLRVERRQRLVHQEDFRIVGEGARDPHTLFHAAGELMRIMAGESGEPDHREHLPRARLALGAADAAVLEAKGDVVADGAPGQERVLLEHHRRQRASRDDRPGCGPRRRSGGATRPARAGAWICRCRSADDAEKLAGVSLERDPVERQDRAPVALEGHADLVHEDLGRRCRHRSVGRWRGTSDGPGAGPDPSRACLLQSFDTGPADLRVLGGQYARDADRADELAVDTIGSPPSRGLAPGTRRIRRFAPPCPSASSNALVGRRKATAEYAFSRATRCCPTGAVHPVHHDEITARVENGDADVPLVLVRLGLGAGP
jgi:hypothetical protein